MSNYTISDYLAGTRLPNRNSSQVAVLKCFNQFAILKSALDVLPSRVADIANVIRAELFDEELATATELTKAGHLRGAGAVAGVVLERHLRQVAADHGVPIRKKKATLADLNDALKKGDVYDVPTWRRVQLLTDIRNLAVHDRERAPTVEEVTELITGVSRAVKSIF